MTTVTLFYDNPLYAALMAQEHGVKIRDEGAEDSSRIDWKLVVGNVMYGRGSCGFKGVVHPDSNHIFEHQEGDFVLKYSHNTVYFYEVHKNDFDDFDYFGTELIYWGQSGYESEISGNVVIIQRDNKPFIMPKKVTS